MVLPPVKMFDASTPPSSAPPGYHAVAGYIGGDTPHVWTDAEWKRFGRLRKLPIWVRSDPAAVNAEADPFSLFIRLASIEIIAEAVSVEFLASKAFVSVLGEQGSEWFRVHAAHDSGMTHEELELRLAFIYAEGLPDEVLANTIIQCVVDAFLRAAEASAKVVC